MLTKQKQVLWERLDSRGGWRWETRPRLSKEVTCVRKPEPRGRCCHVTIQENRIPGSGDERRGRGGWCQVSLCNKQPDLSAANGTITSNSCICGPWVWAGLFHVPDVGWWFCCSYLLASP